MKILGLIEIVIDDKLPASKAFGESGQKYLRLKSYKKNPSKQNWFISPEASMAKLFLCGAISGSAQFI
jgi:hypothetical protein